MDTAGGVLFAKLLNVFYLKRLKINPTRSRRNIGFPMSARVIHKMAQDEDKGQLPAYAKRQRQCGRTDRIKFSAGGLILTLVPYFL